MKKEEILSQNTSCFFTSNVFTKKSSNFMGSYLCAFKINAPGEMVCECKYAQQHAVEGVNYHRRIVFMLCLLFISFEILNGAPVPNPPSCLTHTISEMRAISLHHRFSLVERCKDSITKFKQIEKNT